MISLTHIQTLLTGLPGTSPAHRPTKGEKRLDAALQAVKNGADYPAALAEAIGCKRKHAAKLLEILHERGKVTRTVQGKSYRKIYTYKVQS